MCCGACRSAGCCGTCGTAGCCGACGTAGPAGGGGVDRLVCLALDLSFLTCILTNIMLLSRF